VKVPLLCLVLEKQSVYGAEIGATTSTFGYDDSMGRYLRSTDRSDVADAADKAT
jgi:aconitase A